MRNRRKCIFYTLFLMTAVMFEGYCLLELREDLISLVCSGIVVLIAAYLFMDMVIEFYRKERDRFLLLKSEEQIHKDLQEIIKYERALTIINKKILEQREDL